MKPAKFMIAALITLCFTMVIASAQSLPEPQGRVVLMVTGNINVTNTSGEAHFDLAMLRNLGTRTIETNTIWTKGVQTFSGVPLKTVMDRLGASGTSLRLVAVNDYSIEIPMSHVEEDAAVLAFERNGKVMSLREKGPVWLVFPYDSDRKYQTEVYHSRSVWQLAEIAIQR